MKDMGDIVSGAIVPPTRNGRRAVVEMDVKIYVEVFESDDYGDMVEQAKDVLNQRVMESNIFYPISARADKLHINSKVQDLKARTYVDTRGQW